MPSNRNVVFDHRPKEIYKSGVWNQFQALSQDEVDEEQAQEEEHMHESEHGQDKKFDPEGYAQEEEHVYESEHDQDKKLDPKGPRLFQCRLLELPGEIRNAIFHYAVMVPLSRHRRLDPGPPVWKGTTHLLRLNSQIYSEVRHLLHDKPNRVTLNAFTPLYARKQPLIRACMTDHSSWALRKYTLPQVSCMNNLTIRIPYFEWMGPPVHSLSNYEILFSSKEVAEGQRQQIEISRQLYILAAAASHNPYLKRLTLAFRGCTAHREHDEADPDAVVYTYLQKVLEPLVRFRGPDFDIRAISYELLIAKAAGQSRVEFMARWFNNARADWVRRVRECKNGVINSQKPLDTLSSSKLITQSDSSLLEVSLIPTTVTDFDIWVPREIWEHSSCCQCIYRPNGIPYYGCCGNVWNWAGVSRYCVRCHHEVFPSGIEGEKPGGYRKHGEDGEEWDGPCVAVEDGKHDYGLPPPHLDLCCGLLSIAEF